MPRERKQGNGCTGHTVNLCEENREAVMKYKLEVEKKHQTSVSEIINRIIEEWRAKK